VIPIRILTQRTVAASCVIAACLAMASTGLMYYLPIYFQASKGLAPTLAGIYMLAFAVPSPVASILSGAVLAKVGGSYTGWMIASSVFLTIGSGLLSTLNPSSSLANIVGYQLIAGAGFGFGVQMPLVAIRNVLDEDDIPLGSALFALFQSLGTSLGLSISQAVFLRTLTNRLLGRLSEEETTQVIASGAASVHLAQIPQQWVGFVTAAYSDAVQAALYQCIGSAGFVFLCSWAVEKKDTREPTAEAGRSDEENGTVAS
jgi:hypothetical protein